MLPVVPLLVLILAPFCALSTTESRNVMSATVLLLFPPTEPIESPCDPSHQKLLTETYCPDVIATQSSSLYTRLLLRTAWTG
jgi:hypothetical protein